MCSTETEESLKIIYCERERKGPSSLVVIALLEAYSDTQYKEEEQGEQGEEEREEEALPSSSMLFCIVYVRAFVLLWVVVVVFCKNSKV